MGLDIDANSKESQISKFPTPGLYRFRHDIQSS